jgi:nucleoside-triphosphatase THEP1
MGQGACIGLLTGPIGVGKTTVAERVVGQARRRGLVCGGLLTPAMSTGCGQKAGIWGLDLLSAERRLLARTDRELDGPTVGPYSFGAAALAWANDVLERAVGACDLLIVDEIGKLELWRGIGLAPILAPLAAGEVSRSLVVVREELLSELRGKLKAVEQVVFAVSEANRDDLAGQILDTLMPA